MKNRLYLKWLGLGILTGMLCCNSLQAQITLVNDTIDLTPLIPKTVDVLANDIIPPGDSIKVIGGGGIYVHIAGQAGGTFTFVANYQGIQWGAPPIVTGSYHVIDYTLDTNASALLVFRIRDYSYDSLYLNNINAQFQANGIHFYGPDHARFEVPKFSGKNTIFLSTLWMAGMDQNSNLHLASQLYGQGPGYGSAHTKYDFFAGPVMDSAAYSIYQDTLWNYIWNVKKSEIDYHKAHYADPGYQPVHDILTWPGNGNVSLGQAAQLAPYFDRNENGIYNPLDGDYPLIRGDQALFFIFNDDRQSHSETQGAKLRAEVHGMAYAFDLPEDTAFNNTIFLNYKIFNRSNNIYTNTYFGIWTDLDIGWFQDDYIGCDVERGMYYGYNGNPVDGNGQPGSYGDHPPVQSVTFLGGPFLDPDGCDNPSFKGSTLSGPGFKGDCSIVGLDSTTLKMHYGPGNADSGNFIVRSEAINGVNFGDGIPDNERYGMRRFLYYNNDGSVMGNPMYAADYYNYLRGIWKDGERVLYGGDGHPIWGGYGPECDFMFPDLSDTCNWGTGGIIPSPKLWTEGTANNAPGDRRGLGSTGPFTFLPGAVQELDLAYTFARDYTGKSPLGSLEKLRDMTDVIKKSFTSNVLPDGSSFNGTGKSLGNSEGQIRVYPNPASSQVYVRFEGSDNEPVSFRIFNSNGLLIQTEQRPRVEGIMTLDVSGLSSGLYLITIERKGQIVTKKLSVVK
ncbi:MAG: T9SS type A sorting domain-containing protein [Bacteroidetes bacterium]|nr:T9SS type A sorting domain-containing protein [Bacteroidota bacterium]